MLRPGGDNPGGEARRDEWAKAHFSFDRNAGRAVMMTFSVEQIRTAADRVAASHGLEVVEIEYAGDGKHRLLRISIEKNREERLRAAESHAAQGNGKDGAPHAAAEPAGEAALDRLAWVTHEDCERFSRDLGPLLDVESLTPESSYTLEVSSPGLDRKLHGAVDFERFRGALVKLQTFAPVSGNRHWQGRLIEVRSGGIAIQPGQMREKKSSKNATAARETLQIDFSNIERANLVPEF